tara:strand:+ start:783 stop:995 length:213 start_codon:yes stop_codon:yes gene_type:complete
MAHTSKNLKKIYLNRINNLKYNEIKDRGIRKMSERLWEEFDEIWIKYNNNEATYEQWEKALNKWLNSETI